MKTNKKTKQHLFSDHKIDFLESFANFTGKHLCWSHLLMHMQA